MTTAVQSLLAAGLKPGQPLRALAASGQLGYGIPTPAFHAGMARDPHFVGCDMGSIDVGPYYLGSGRLATSEAITRRDLTLVLRGARERNVPLLIGTAGTSGAAPHLARTLEMLRDIARAERLDFKMAVIGADMPRDLVARQLQAGRVHPLGRIPPLDEAAVRDAAHIVGQMGNEAFIRALACEPDVIVAGRACDTAVFASIPVMLGYDTALAVHMAKIIECTSICCDPGGRDAILGTLERDSFTLESMNPERAATPVSVAAHSLYEQADPMTVQEPDGTLDVGQARFEAVDARRTRVSGATWREASQKTVKIEGAQWVAERAVVCAGSCDPRVIANLAAIEAGVRKNVAAVLEGSVADYELVFRVYGAGATQVYPGARIATGAEVFFLLECLAPTADAALAAATVAKQYLLHHGFPGRLSTGGNIAFPFTPPELRAGTAYRYSVYHIMECDDLPGLFPVEVEQVRGGVQVAGG
ncbi:PF07287 domain protein [Bordetella bronchiseptica MBORD635]|uniref:acyclic terpene utilization AtuA family protein n=1 Tax=Bordetella bronchiseptica TaxID=518 RepID=UPI000461DFA0|nr:acyclic terpene utilization AtuA family protein [Bordetella bronchiseptica]KDC79697.1 PF07287 domain protein [Bordetella bronchiseptica MBORD635]